MKKLLIFSLVGFFAQLVDGALGMAYGATSSSLLLMLGVAPSVASASIHFAEIATTGVSGLSHYRFGNVDQKMLFTLIIPGSLGAFVGAAFLSHLPGNLIKPYISAFLLLLGVYVLFRFLFRPVQPENMKGKAADQRRYLIPLGAVAGFFDAIGGGGWGPINTPVLLSKNAATPRKVIGTVDTSEFAVTVSASLGFVIFLGWEQFNWYWVGAFVFGGVLAAPLAAWLVKIIPTYLLGVLVGGFIILTNTRTILHAAGVSNHAVLAVYAILSLLWISAILYVFKKARKTRARSRSRSISSEVNFD